MQNTLLGLAIAIILALVAALVAPLVIDWSGQRSMFEVQASRLLGVDVRVTGAIDARLLPSPRLTLNDIEIGKPGPDAIHARSLGIEFALSPLMRGEWRASDLTITAPQVRLGLDASGHVQAPALAVGFDADALTVDRLAIQEGTVTFADASNGATIKLERVWFNGDARSLLGPFKGEGAVTIGNELYPFRLASSRYSDDTGARVRVNVDPVNRPLSIEAEGALVLTGGDPKFDGTLSLSRPVGVGLRGASVTQPWRMTGKVKASAAAALFQQIEFQYGSEEQGLKLTGVADFKFGTRPRFDGVLSGRQIDLDRAMPAADGTRPLPAAAIRQLAEFGGGVFRPSIPIQIGVGIDQVTLGGNTVQNVRGDITSDTQQGWSLDRFEFRAPGFTQVRLSGRLAVGGDNVSFTGPAELDSTDPKALTAWLEGEGDSAQTDLRPLKLRGDVTLASDKVAVERLRAEFDRRTITGRMAYGFAAGDRKAKLDAELNASELDIDAALGFGNAVLAGSRIDRPHDMTIAADIGRATIAGLTARNASVRLKVDAGGLQIDRLSVTDFGGAAFSASGRIVATAPSPQGDMRIDLDAPDMTPVTALLARFAPETAAMLASRASLMAPAKLRARLTIDGANASTVAKLGIDGSLGKVRVALNGQGNADVVAFRVGDIKLDGKFEADDGKVLVAMLGLSRAVAVDAGAGALTVKASGPAQGDMQIESRLTAGGLDASIAGTAKLFSDKRTAALRANLRADIGPLRGPGAAQPTLPVTFASRVALAGNDLSFADINATIGGASLRGKLSATLQRPSRIEGDLEADTIDGAALVAAATGMPAVSGANKLPANAAWAWSSEPFGDNVFGDYTGQIALKARRLDALPRFSAREFRGTLRLDKNELVVDDMSGDVAGGRLAARLLLRSAPEGLKTNVKVALTGIDAATLMVPGPRPSVSGRFDLSADMEGNGLSPVALIGSLQGLGKIALADGQFAGLDPRAFDVVTRAVDQGLPIDGIRVGDVVRRALDSGQLAIKRADGKLSMSAGQVRLGDVTIDSKDADLTLSGAADLTDGSVGARMVLSGMSKAAGARPDIFMSLQGPAAAPSRTIDVSALAGWLTLRSVENQTRHLRMIEGQGSAAQAPPQQAPAAQVPSSETIPAPKSRQAPALPAPVDIKPLPMPAR
ncbi:MAG TPA: AsmA-like C-terminal region-containing protein [Pseudolabrys sp.]